MFRFRTGVLAALAVPALLAGCAGVGVPECGSGSGLSQGGKCRVTSGSAPRSYSDSYVALLEDADGTVGQVLVEGDAGAQTITTAGTGALLDGSQPPVPLSREKLERDFGAALSARPILPKRFVLYFASGLTLTADSAAQLEQIVEDSARRPSVDVSITGHTDTAGTTDSNDSLALRRAQSIANKLKSLGLKVSTLVVESHGEENLAVETADDVSEPRNRRVEVSVR